MRVLCEPLVHEHLRTDGQQKEWWQHTDERQRSRSNATHSAAVVCTSMWTDSFIHSFIQRGTSMCRCVQCPQVRTVLLVARAYATLGGTVHCGSTLQYSQPAAEWQQCYSERQAEPRLRKTDLQRGDGYGTADRVAAIRRTMLAGLDRQHHLTTQ
jgi:hypothetical protein